VGGRVNGLHQIRSEIVAAYQEELDGLTTSPQEIIGRRNAETEAFLTERLIELNARISEISTAPVELMNVRLAAVREEVATINREIERQYGPGIVSLNAVVDEVRHDAEAVNGEVRRIAEEGIDEINAGIRDIDDRHSVEIDGVQERIVEIRTAIRRQTEEAAAPVIDRAEWPEPEEEDGAIGALFDSRRSYMEQIEHYRRHQGKDPAPILKRGYRFKLICEICGNSFERAKRASTCSSACRQAKFRQLVAACRDSNA
jgi:hypothetical protein